MSSSETANINLPYLIQGKEDMIHFETVLTREKFNELTSDLVERTATPVMTAMNDAGLAPSELQKVLQDLANDIRDNYKEHLQFNERYTEQGVPSGYSQRLIDSVKTQVVVGDNAYEVTMTLND